MRQRICLFCIFLFMICSCSCSSDNLKSAIESDEARNVVQTECNGGNYLPSTTEELQHDWEYLDVQVFSDESSTINDIHFLVTEEVALEEPVYKMEVDNTNIILELLQNLQVKKAYDMISYADYYLLFRDKDDTPICLIEVWDRYICINHSNFYEVSSDELFMTIDKMINESKELTKVSVEDILIAYAKEHSYGEFDEEDIVLYNKQPAILVESGYESSYSEEEIYFERFIYCNGLYFDKDYQTTYMLSQCKIYYWENGKVREIFSERVTYYDYFTAEKRLFMY